MKIIAAVDDSMGLMFNGRRQSQDKVLREHIIADTKGVKLWMSEYSAKQFGKDLPENAVVSDTFMDEAAEGEYVFIEGEYGKIDENRIEEVILYKWNRKYPGDVFLKIDFGSLRIYETQDFSGTSHEKITKEVYR